MFLPSWRNRVTSSYTNRAARRRRAKIQPKLQSLEPRALLSATPTGTTIAPIEGQVFSGTVATFTADDAGPFSASIDWGDGTITGGTVAPNAGVFTVQGQHTYAEEGTEPISVEIIDAADSTTATALSTANVSEGSFVLSGSAPVTATEGQALTGLTLATFSDPGSPDAATDFAATIVWGDGATTAGSVTGSGGNFTVTGSHTYADELNGSYLVTVSEPGANFTLGPVSSAVTVVENDVVNLANTAIAATEGQAFSGTVASFNDSGNPLQVASGWTASVDWGDGTATAGTVTGPTGGPFTISGTHSYADEGTFPVVASLSDNSPGSVQATVTSTATVAEGDFGSLNPTTITPTEGQAFSGMVASFTDQGNPLQVAGDFTANVDWGDGTISTGTVSGPTGGPFTISGNHTYAEDGAYTVLATFSDDPPSSLTSIPITSTAVVSEGDLTALPVATTISATEGATFSGILATIADPGSSDPASDFSANIDWGDGTTTSGTVSGAAGIYTVSGAHAYADEGAFSVTVTATENSAPPAATATLTASVAEGDFGNLISATVSSTEGQIFSGMVASFTDSGNPLQVAGDFSASIDWGDGATTSGTVSGPTGGPFTISGNHTYADEGTFTVLASFADDAPSTLGATITSTATVSEADVLTGTAGPIAATEGTVFTGSALAVFTDSGFAGNVAADFTATIDWGDGTSGSGVVSGGAGTFTVSGNHNYADEGSFPVTITLADDAPGTATATATATASVADNDTLAGTATASATEGTTFTGTVATFTDAGYAGNVPGDFAATIDWGDGTTTAGTVSGGSGTFTVSGSHLYADEGSNPLSVTLTENSPGAASATAAGTATVSDNDTLVAGTAVTAAATEGATFSGALATFTDTTYAGNLPGDFSATVNWGDGTVSAGTVGGSAGSFTVSGSHVYAEEGTMTPAIVLSDNAPGAAAATATATINVADATLSATGTTITLPEATLRSPLVVATFTDANPNATTSDFTATIDWGDGTTTQGAVTTAPPPVGGPAGGGGQFYVSGGHVYAEDGTCTIKVSVADVGGGKATATSTATITEPSLTISPLAVSGHERSALTGIVVAEFSHGGGDEPAADFNATIDWGDGTVSAGVVSEQAGTYVVGGSHTYLDERHYTLHVNVSDDAASASVAVSATITEELLPNGTEGTPNQRFVQEVYRDLFHRPVDQAGLNHWTSLLDQGQTRFQVVSAIITAAMPGELGTDLVTGMFQKYLDRNPDAAGLAHWVGVVNGQTTIENTEAAIVASPEFYALAGGTNTGFIQRLFEKALGRSAEAPAVLYYNSLLSAGLSRELVADFILNSPEYLAREVASYYQSPSDLNAGSTVALPYLDDLDFLDRAADPVGLATFTAALKAGTADQRIWANMMASDEFFAKIA